MLIRQLGSPSLDTQVLHYVSWKLIYLGSEGQRLKIMSQTQCRLWVFAILRVLASSVCNNDIQMAVVYAYEQQLYILLVLSFINAS